MIAGLLGRKLHMGRTVDASGAVVATTFVSAGPCYVTQIKTRERDGYEAAQIGYGEAKRLSRPEAGHLGGTRKLKYLKEVPLQGDDELDVGQEFNVSVFEPGDIVDVTGVSKGRGFAGVVKRHGFHGGPKTHGQSDRWRALGSSGAGTTPGRVLKGTRMAGRMGAERVTVKNLEVLAVDPERNLIAVKGAVPGPTGGIIRITRRGTASRTAQHGD
jgi:large subunit ribosomal protein L3